MTTPPPVGLSALRFSYPLLLVAACLLPAASVAAEVELWVQPSAVQGGTEQTPLADFQALGGVVTGVEILHRAPGAPEDTLTALPMTSQPVRLAASGDAGPWRVLGLEVPDGELKEIRLHLSAMGLRTESGLYPVQLQASGPSLVLVPDAGPVVVSDTVDVRLVWSVEPETLLQYQEDQGFSLSASTVPVSVESGPGALVETTPEPDSSGSFTVDSDGTSDAGLMAQGHDPDKLDIRGFSPLYAHVGEEIVITGEFYVANPEDLRVKFGENGEPAEVDVVAEDHLVVRLPQAATIGQVHVVTETSAAASDGIFVPLLSDPLRIPLILPHEFVLEEPLPVAEHSVLHEVHVTGDDRRIAFILKVEGESFPLESHFMLYLNSTDEWPEHWVDAFDTRLQLYAGMVGGTPGVEGYVLGDAAVIVVPLTDLPQPELDYGDLNFFLEVEHDLGNTQWPDAGEGGVREPENTVLVGEFYGRQQLIVHSQDPLRGPLLAVATGWRIMAQLDDSDLGLGFTWLFLLPEDVPVWEGMHIAHEHGGDEHGGLEYASPNYYFSGSSLPPTGECRDGDVNKMFEAEFLGESTVFSQYNLPLTRSRSAIHSNTAFEFSTGEGEIVFVLDDGIDSSHPEFAGAIFEEGTCVLFNCDGAEKGPEDYHGTRVASVIVGQGNTVFGIAPSARIMPIRMARGKRSKSGKQSSRSSTIGLIRALRHAVDVARDEPAARIVNYSVGWGSHWALYLAEGALLPGPPLYHWSLVGSALHIERLVVKGDLMFVQSAGHIRIPGNISDNLPDGRLWPSGYFLNADRSLVVANANDERRVIRESTRSSAVDVSAPGTCVVVAHESGGWLPRRGTSYSAPMGAGALALLRSRSQELGGSGDVRVARGRLLRTAVPVSGARRAEGYGFIDVGSAVRSFDSFFMFQAVRVPTRPLDLDVTGSGNLVFTVDAWGVGSYDMNSHEEVARLGLLSKASWVLADRLSEAAYIPQSTSVAIRGPDLSSRSGLSIPTEGSSAQVDLPVRPEVTPDGSIVLVPFVERASADSDWTIAAYQSIGHADALGQAHQDGPLFFGEIESGHAGGHILDVLGLAVSEDATSSCPFVLYSLENQEVMGEEARYIVARCWDSTQSSWSTWGEAPCPECKMIQAAGPGRAVVLAPTYVQLYHAGSGSLAPGSVFHLPSEARRATIGVGRSQDPVVNVFAQSGSLYRRYHAALAVTQDHELVPFLEETLSGAQTVSDSYPIRMTEDPQRGFGLWPICNVRENDDDVGGCVLLELFNVPASAP